MSCYFCVHWRDNGQRVISDQIARQKGLCTLEREWMTTTGDHHCSRIVYRQVPGQCRTWAHEMMAQRDEFSREAAKEKAERTRLERQNKELRKKLKEAKQ